MKQVMQGNPSMGCQVSWPRWQRFQIFGQIPKVFWLHTFNGHSSAGRQKLSAWPLAMDCTRYSRSTARSQTMQACCELHQGSWVAICACVSPNMGSGNGSIMRLAPVSILFFQARWSTASLPLQEGPNSLLLELDRGREPGTCS